MGINEHSWEDLMISLHREDWAIIHLYAKVDKPSQLTKGKTYELRLEGPGKVPTYRDDIDIPTALTPATYREFFHSIQFLQTPATPDELKAVTAKQYYASVAQTVTEITQAMGEQKHFERGDIVVNEHLPPEYRQPMIVVRYLTPDEQLTVAHLLNTIARFDLAVFRENDGGNVSVISSCVVTKVGSLEEWGLPAIDPKALGTFTVFD